MDTSNKNNMALKLEQWLLAKQAGASIPLPLRPVAHAPITNRRTSSLQGQETPIRTRRKSFSRLTPQCDDDVSNRSSSATKPKMSPSRKLSGDGMMLLKPNQFAIFVEEIDDENSKENQPVRALNVTRQDANRLNASLGVDKSHPSETKSTNSMLRQQQCVTTSEVREPTPDISLSPPNICTDEPTPPSTKRTTHSRLSVDKPVTPGLRNRDSLITVHHHEKSIEISLQEDLQAMMFLNSVLEQKIIELEQTISRDRLEQNEHVANRGKKHKTELKRLTLERSHYEERANQMMTEMGEQMLLLQNTAMDRIEVLEKDLMSERHNSEALKQENATLLAKVEAANSRVNKSARLRSSSGACIEKDYLSGRAQASRDSSSNSEADYFTDDTAHASDNEDEEGEKEMREAYLEDIFEDKSDLVFDVIPPRIIEGEDI